MVIEPFRLRGGRRGGALLVHGFTGSPQEMRGLAEPLAAAGLDVLGVRLPGHGAPADEEPNHWSAWRGAVAAGLAELEADGSRGRTAVVGLSMGALLAIELAAREPERIRAVAALSPALTLPLRLRATLRVAGRVLPRSACARRIPKGESDIRDPVARAAHPRAAPFPLSAVLSFNELRLAVRRRVGSLAQPLLIVHSRRDRTCPVAGAAWLARRAGSAEVALHLLEHSGHVIPVDVERATAERLLLEFLARTLGGE